MNFEYLRLAREIFGLVASVIEVIIAIWKLVSEATNYQCTKTTTTNSFSQTGKQFLSHRLQADGMATKFKNGFFGDGAFRRIFCIYACEVDTSRPRSAIRRIGALPVSTFYGSTIA